MTHSQKFAAEVAMIGGTLSGVWATYSHDVIRTILFAAIGAGTSFVVTLVLKLIVKKIFKK